MPLVLEMTKRTDERLLDLMEKHYSEPKGFVGRNICYAVLWNDVYFGHIVGGSATKFLPGRNDFFGVNNLDQLVHIINNIFFHIEPFQKYPIRNFTTHVVEIWRARVAFDWRIKYGNKVIGFETLIELPRTGELYKKDGWVVVGQTHGYTCKRTGGIGTDSWTGKRVWDTQNLRPKLVLVKKRVIQ